VLVAVLFIKRGDVRSLYAVKEALGAAVTVNGDVAFRKPLALSQIAS
jgi:hypothetical protein